MAQTELHAASSTDTQWRSNSVYVDVPLADGRLNSVDPLSPPARDSIAEAGTARGKDSAAEESSVQPLSPPGRKKKVLSAAHASRLLERLHAEGCRQSDAAHMAARAVWTLQ